MTHFQTTFNKNTHPRFSKSFANKGIIRHATKQSNFIYFFHEDVTEEKYFYAYMRYIFDKIRDTAKAVVANTTLFRMEYTVSALVKNKCNFGTISILLSLSQIAHGVPISFSFGTFFIIHDEINFILVWTN